jgi:hypothetical protein
LWESAEEVARPLILVALEEMVRLVLFVLFGLEI